MENNITSARIQPQSISPRMEDIASRLVFNLWATRHRTVYFFAIFTEQWNTSLTTNWFSSLTYYLSYN